MPDPNDPLSNDPLSNEPGDPNPIDAGHVPVEGDSEERVTPRRAASAEFVVDSDVGSEAMLREAMDPANQSLAEALRLSYRVLQLVILVLVVLFIFSGFQTVQSGQNGVLLRWGRILTRDGSKALGEGPKFSKWPYPAGEFVLFESRDRSARVMREFWPELGNRDFNTAVGNATENQRLRPGRDGYLLTEGGDIAHLQIETAYDIDYPERYVYAVEDENADPARLDADRLVELSMQRAAVHFAATRSLEEIVEINDVDRDEIRRLAQGMLDLDDIDSGIRITSVDVPNVSPALAIKRTFDELQEARVQSDEQVTKARQAAAETLIAAIGGNAEKTAEITAAVDGYEVAFAADDAEAAEAALVRINDLLDDPEVTGEVAAILSYARSYRSTIERTLGQEARRFMGQLAAYRDSPDIVIDRLWMEKYGEVLSRVDSEKIFRPRAGAPLVIALVGSDGVRQTRRQADMDRREAASYSGLGITDPYVQRGRDMQEGPGRRLDRDSTSGR